MELKMLIARLHDINSHIKSGMVVCASTALDSLIEDLAREPNLEQDISYEYVQVDQGE